MMVSTRGRYALQVMLDLARNDSGEFISLKDISERQKISMKYLESIVSVMLNAGLLQSRRGAMGGYRLSRRPEEYSVGEIMRLTEGSLAPVSCVDRESGFCERADSCLTLPMWKKLDRLIDGYLSSVSIKDLLESNPDKF